MLLVGIVRVVGGEVVQITCMIIISKPFAFGDITVKKVQFIFELTSPHTPRTANSYVTYCNLKSFHEVESITKIYLSW